MSYVQLPYRFTLAQRDTLTILVVCARRRRLARLLFQAIPQTALQDTHFLVAPESTGLLGYDGNWRDGRGVVTLFFTPFVDTKYYALGGTFWTMVFGGFATAFCWTYFGWKALEAYRDPIAAKAELRKRLAIDDWKTKPLRVVDRGVWLSVKWFVGTIVAPWMFPDNWQKLTNGGYWSSFAQENLVSLVLLVLLAASVVAVIAQTLVPVFRIVVFGLVLCLLGLSAGQLRSIYEKYFVPAAWPASAVR
ncbi:MAG: hypothetical protein ABMA14_26325 [Hyphomonadaceae bacterium]